MHNFAQIHLFICFSIVYLCKNTILALMPRKKIRPIKVSLHHRWCWNCLCVTHFPRLSFFEPNSLCAIVLHVTDIRSETDSIVDMTFQSLQRHVVLHRRKFWSINKYICICHNEVYCIHEANDSNWGPMTCRVRVRVAQTQRNHLLLIELIFDAFIHHFLVVSKNGTQKSLSPYPISTKNYISAYLTWKLFLFTLTHKSQQSKIHVFFNEFLNLWQ